MNREGVNADQVIREARQAADSYLRGSRVKKGVLDRLPGLVWGAAGAVLASLGWCVVLFS